MSQTQPSTTAAADSPQAASLTPEEAVEQLRTLLARIPVMQSLTPRERHVLRHRKQMPEPEIRASIHLIEASDKVEQAIGKPAASARELLDDSTRWALVELELRGVLRAVSDAVLLRRQRATVVATQAYGIARQLTRDPANAVLVPHVEEVRRLKALRVR